MRRVGAILILLFLALSFSGCRNNILAEDAAYYTETINSLLWCRGNSSDGARIYRPKIEIVEKDAYGRVLFSYREGFSTDHEDLSSLNIYGFLIMQAEDDEFVYYYEDVNYVCVNFTDYREDVCSRKVDELKIANDWGKELNLDKCIKKIKSTRKIKNNLDSSVNGFIDKKEKEAGIDFRVCVSAQDDFGRTIISMSEFGGTPWQGRLIVCIIQPDGSVVCSDDYSLVFDYFEYSNDLQVLKDKANWNNEFIAE